MTRLTLLRHAKSAWDNPENTDEERPLNQRGRRDAPLMGLVCAEKIPRPSLILVSSALRTRETIDLFTEAWAGLNAPVVVDERLYLASLSVWVEVISEHASEESHILGCAHQPGIGNFASWLDEAFRGDIPTASVLSFSVDVTADSEMLERGCGRLDFHGTPRVYR